MKNYLSLILASTILFTANPLLAADPDKEEEVSHSPTVKNQQEHMEPEKLDVLSKQKAAIQTYIEYKQGCEDLQKAKDVLKIEETAAKKRAKQAKAGNFISPKDYKSTLANYHNGYMTVFDVLESQANEIQLELNNIKDPLTRARKEVQLRQDRVTEAGIHLETLLGLPKDHFLSFLEKSSQQ